MCSTVSVVYGIQIVLKHNTKMLFEEARELAD